MTQNNRRAYYRRDLDGLRAVAILAVLGFHAGLPLAASGFVGVDIFFVLSGFLISSIVYREIKSGTFTFRSFYERRARRILPALFTVMITSYAMAATLLTARELRSFAAQSVAALGCVSNVFFWRSLGYFDAHAELKPLLMTWSLGVEEQFYLLFPIIVVVVSRKYRDYLVSVLVTLSVASFAISLFQTSQDPQTAFYMLPSRWWEIGVGTLLGLRWHGKGVQKMGLGGTVVIREAFAIVGMLVLVVGIIYLRRTAPFPGLGAAPIVIATALIILAEGSWLNENILGSPPLVAIGLVSYSWYLWHWPLLSIARISAGGNISVLSSLIICFIALLLSIATFYFVEKPLRNSDPHPQLLWKYGVLSLMMVAGPLLIIKRQGWTGRYPTADQVEAAARPSISNPCLVLDHVSAVPQGGPCMPPSASHLPVLAVMGDSHAASVANYLGLVAVSRGWSLAQYTKVNCPPSGTVGVHSLTSPGLARECPAFFQMAARAIADDPNVRTVLITGLWTDWVDPRYPGRHYNPPSGDAIEVSKEMSLINLKMGINEMIRPFVLQGKHVILAMDVPEVPFDPLLRSLSKAIPARRRLGGFLGAGEWRADTFYRIPSHEEQEVAEILRSVAAANHVEYIDLSAAMCADRHCKFMLEEKPLYFDKGHLSIEGAGYALRNNNLFR